MDATIASPDIGTMAWSSVKAFLVALAATPILRDVFHSYHIVDRPGLRKVHAYPIPRLGGLALAIAYVAGLAGLHLHDLLWELLPGSAVVFVTGIVDDFFDLPPRFKLAGQIAAASLAYWMGLRVPGPKWISFLGTVFWLVLSSNALNLVDGLDGLCAGLGCTGACVLFAMALVQGDAAMASAMLVLAGALLGFLCHNFNRATMFLGDSGALSIGFLLGCGGLMWCQKTGPQISMAAPLLVISVPVTDLCVSIVRRRAAGRPIFTADRGHAHHRLLDLGLTPRAAVLALYAWGAGGGLFAFLLGYPPLHAWRGVIIAGFLAVTLACIQRLRYPEFKWRHS